MKDQRITGLSARSLWFGWIITLLIPGIGLFLFLPSWIEREESQLLQAYQRLLVSDMRDLQRQLFLYDHSSRQEQDLRQQLEHALASTSTSWHGCARQLLLNEDQLFLPGFLQTAAGMAYRDFLPAEFYHLILPRHASSTGSLHMNRDAPVLCLETSIPLSQLVHPRRSLFEVVWLFLLIALLLSAVIILLRHRIPLPFFSLRLKTGAMIGLGLFLPITGFWLATISRYDTQNLLQKMELTHYLEHQLESLEYRLASDEDQMARKLLRLIDSHSVSLAKPESAKSALEQIMSQWPTGVLCLFRSDRTYVEVEPKQERYLLPEHQGLREGVRRIMSTAIRPLFSAPVSQTTTDKTPSPEEVFLQELLETVVPSKRIHEIYRNPGILFQGFETLSFTRTLFQPLASHTLILEMTGKGEFFWVPFLNRLLRGIPGEPLSQLREEIESTTIEYGVFLKPYRHALSFERLWLPIGIEDRQTFIQAAHQNLVEGNSRLTDSWSDDTPSLLFIRPFSKLPIVGIARATPRPGSLPTHRLAGLLTGIYALALLLFLAGVLTRLTSAPIALFIQAVERVQDGDYQTRLNMPTGDEIEEIGGTFNAMVEALDQKRRMSRFVSENVMEAIKEDNAGEGRREIATVLFCHVRDFEEMLLSSAPEEIFHFLNLYFTQMGFVIRRQGGTIDKFIGDAVMAVFQDRGSQPITEPAPVRAARAALLMQEQLANMNTFRRERQQSSVSIGIGIHHGEVIAGRIGSQHGRLDFTVIGDTVNLAARLESQSRLASETGILISSSVEASLPIDIQRRPLGQITVKGRAESVTVFTLSGSTPTQKL
ncbi:MAG TPA: adenylate/guanylate cyclase domain-containing protein [Candidatus Ozemobacteraceae bacterium]|nr:adenylate/guanylate cyclase domain-containing protein [Candidatus Ozemobacteraceae bacterium]